MKKGVKDGQREEKDRDIETGKEIKRKIERER